MKHKDMPDYTIPNLKNACRILETLGRAQEGLSNADLAKQLEIPRSTVLRILATLEAQKFVARNGKRFHLGISLIPLGESASSQYSLLDLSEPIICNVSKETDETCHLLTLTNDKALILQVCESPHPMRTHSKSGTLADLHCSAGGKAMLATLPHEQQGSLVNRLALQPKTPHTICNKSDLKKELKQVAKQGYAMDEQEYHVGVRCMAVPVLSKHTDMNYAVGITASVSRFTKDRIPSVLQILQSASEELAKAVDLGL